MSKIKYIIVGVLSFVVMLMLPVGLTSEKTYATSPVKTKEEVQAEINLQLKDFVE